MEISQTDIFEAEDGWLVTHRGWKYYFMDHNAANTLVQDIKTGNRTAEDLANLKRKPIRVISLSELTSTAPPLPIEMHPSTETMALGCFGYGSWEAPYWFIGPEQGMRKDEDLVRRVDVWLQLGGNELDDCREFHELLPEPRWHQQSPILQKTWKQLILFLLRFCNRPATMQDRRQYQRDHWGMSGQQTCVIELSGVPAHSYRESSKQKHRLLSSGEFEQIRNERIKIIRQRILKHRPKLVVMYGEREEKHWKAISNIKELFPDGSQPPGFVETTHPVSFQGVADAYWENLADRVRANMDASLAD